MTGTAHTRRRDRRRAPSRCPRWASRSARSSRATPHRWETVGTDGDFPDNNYVPVVITIAPGIGEAGKTTVYMRKRNPAIDTDPYDQYNAATSRSPRRCAHLGCPVRWVDRRRALHLPLPRRRL